MPEFASPAEVRNILGRHGISPKKSLGQNFLVDPNIADKIISAADLDKTDLVVEIGPGLGALTARAARLAGRVIALELDHRLLPVLAETLQGLGEIEIIQGDALETNYDQLAEEKTGGAFGRHGKQYKLLANLPYYITSPLLLHLLLGRFNFSVILVMIQLEVADRLTAGPGTKDYGSLSVIVQYFTEPKILFRVPRTVFLPSPGVDSAVVRLVVRPKPAVAVQDEEFFFKVVRGAFGQRRKILLNALSAAGLGVSRENCLAALRMAGIDQRRRGETLNLAEFSSLADSLCEISSTVKSF